MVIVSSGAIGVGLRRMDIDKKPRHLPQIQVYIVRWEQWFCMLRHRIGFGSYRSMPAVKAMGQSVRSSPAADRPGAPNAE